MGRRLAATVLAGAVGLSSPGASAATAPRKPATPAAQSRACGAQDVIMTAETLHVAVQAQKRVVRAGQPAGFDLEVSRPGRGDPLGLGPSVDLPARAPAGDVFVAVWMQLPTGAVAALGRTDEVGAATLEVETSPRSPTTSVDMRAFAWNVLIAGCVTLEEVGRVEVTDAFTIKAKKQRRR